MQNRKQLDQDLDFLTTLKSLAMAYEDISILRMQQTRNTIVQSRNYVGLLKDILESIQTSGFVSRPELLTKRKKKPLATVVITANTRFHGDIIRRIFDHFSHDPRQAGDIYIMGRLGKELMYEYDKNKKFTDFEVSDIDISMNDLKPFLLNLLQYKEINVFYAVFKNLINQEPTNIDIGNIDLLSAEEVEIVHKDRSKPTFLFEPSVEEIYTFVNDNAVALLLLQTVYETQLARFASRMKAMDSLIVRIDEDATKIKYTERKIDKNKENAKQQERLGGISLW